MADTNEDTLVEKLDAIGDAIRTKTGGTALLTIDDMPTEIASIETGGGSSGGGSGDKYLEYLDTWGYQNNSNPITHDMDYCDVKWLPSKPFYGFDSNTPNYYSNAHIYTNYRFDNLRLLPSQLFYNHLKVANTTEIVFPQCEQGEYNGTRYFYRFNEAQLSSNISMKFPVLQHFGMNTSGVFESAYITSVYLPKINTDAVSNINYARNLFSNSHVENFYLGDQFTKIGYTNYQTTFFGKAYDVKKVVIDNASFVPTLATN